MFPTAANASGRFGVIWFWCLAGCKEKLGAGRHQPLDRVAIQSGNPEQDRGVGFYKPSVEGGDIALGGGEPSTNAGAANRNLGVVQAIGSFRLPCSDGSPSVGECSRLRGDLLIQLESWHAKLPK